jgi:hypothetical protein
MNTSITESITHHIKITLNEDEYVCDRQGTYFTDNNSFLSNVLTELGWISTSPYKYTKQKSHDDVFTLEATSQYQRRTGKIIGFDLTLGNIDSDGRCDFENDIIVAIEKAVTDKQVTQNRPYVDCDRQGVYVDCDRQGVYEVVTMIDNGVLKWPLINYIGTKDQCFQWVDKNPLAKGIVRRLVIGGPSQVEFDRQFMCTFD